VTQEPERTLEYAVQVIDVGFVAGANFPPFEPRVEPDIDPDVFTDYAAAETCAKRLESQYRALGAHDLAVLIRILTRTVVVRRGKWGDEDWRRQIAFSAVQKMTSAG
jgi:hypothetical protein